MTYDIYIIYIEVRDTNCINERRKMRKLLTAITVAGKANSINEFVDEEFFEAVSKYNFKDGEEVNEIFQALDRCKHKNLFDWCPADTKALKCRLGVM